VSDLRGLDSLTGREVAVIGQAGHFPGAANLTEFWQNLRSGREAVTFFTDDELLAAGVEPAHLRHPNYVKAASLLDGVELFDASFFGYNAREAEMLDPQQRLFLEYAWHALEDSGHAPHEYDGLIGVYAGAAWNTYLLSNLTTHHELFDGGGFQVFIASDKDFMPTRVAYKFNLKGPSMIIQTSCSTSLVALHLACLSLLNYECDIALAGGVTVKVPQKAGYFYQEGGLSSPDGHCRAFDSKAEGTIFGSGVGVVVLKRLSEALDEGDHIRAVIKASAINNDGAAKVSYTAPSVEGQAQVIASAQAMAGFDPETIRYIETHGTGTSLGDPVEVTALSKAFRKSSQRKSFCAIGSVKSNIGHLDAAAGIAGFIKTVLALENRELPPSINFTTPNPSIDFAETPFYVNSKLTGWQSQDLPRRAAVSSFGVGGTNAHVILEEAPPLESSGTSRELQLLVISARTESALNASTENLLSWLRDNESVSLPDAAYTLKIGRTVFRHRRVLVCRDHGDAIRALDSPDGARALTTTDKDEPRERPVVFMFPGQGSQYPGMARQLYDSEITFRKQFDECARLLKSRSGLELQAALYPDGETPADTAARIDDTSLAQPILFVVEYALASLWMEWGVRPAAMIGHSIGEYVAACLAGVLSLEDALSLVTARGKLMQRQPHGRMLAVSLPEEELSQMLPREISLAAVNEPSGCVISGPSDAVAEFEDDLARRNIGFRQLHTSHAFHSRMMDPVLSAFTEEVRRVRLSPPRIPFISNLTGTWITAEQATDPNYWARHLREGVRFSQGLRELLSDPDRIFLEVGPGRVLATLAARHPEGRGRVIVSSVRHPNEEISDEALILESLGRLWLAGVKLDWRGFYKNERRRRVSLPLYPFERQRFWIEPRSRSARAVESTDPGTVKRTDLSEWFYLPSWKPSLLPRSGGEPRNSWLVMLDECGFAEAMADQLIRQGREIVTVAMGGRFHRRDEKSYTIRPGSSEDYKTLLDALKSDGFSPQVILHAFSLTGDVTSDGSVAGFDGFQESGFYSLLYLFQALAQHAGDDFDITVISNSSLAIMAQETLLPEKSPMLGLCRVVAQEFTNVTSRFIDVKLPDPQASPSITRLLDSLISEVDSRTTASVIAYRGRERYVQSFEQVRLDSGGDIAPFRERGVYLITGGLSGNGLSIARYLARTVKARLILIERAPVPGGADGTAFENGIEQQAEAEKANRDPRLRWLEALNESGAEVCLMVADVADQDQLARAWTEGESRFGEIHGVIHAEETSGESAFRAIWEASRDECELHFNLKARALYSLERVLKDKELDFCVLLSSIASVLGGVGYGPYAAANLFMDSFVRRSNRTNRVPWLSLNWDLWLGGDNLDQITAARGDLSELAMTAREGEEAFRYALLARDVDQILVSTSDLTARLNSMQERFEGLRSRRRIGGELSMGAELHPRPQLATLYVAPETDMERSIAAVWQEVLGFELIGVEDNFFELGGDSLIAIQVTSRLKQQLNLDFPVAKLYQGVTVRSLSQLLSQSGDEEQERRAVGQAEREQATSRRREYIERRRSRMRGMEG
jgi:acyl transferase domain-containing protein/acyl carrier protein